MLFEKLDPGGAGHESTLTRTPSSRQRGLKSEGVLGV